MKHRGYWRQGTGDSKNARSGRVFGSLLYSVSCILSPLLIPALAHAAPTQEEFFKSMQSSVDNASDGSATVLWFIGGAVALVLLLCAVGSRQKQRVSKPKVLNHSRKLLREVARNAQLKNWELKELKAAADDGACTSPLTLILCPSLLARSIEEPRSGSTANRRVLAQIARKVST